MVHLDFREYIINNGEKQEKIINEVVVVGILTKAETIVDYMLPISTG